MNKTQIIEMLRLPTIDLIERILSINQHGVLHLPPEIENIAKIKKLLNWHNGVEYGNGRITVRLDWWAVQPIGVEPVKLCFEGIKNWECKNENTTN